MGSSLSTRANDGTSRRVLILLSRNASEMTICHGHSQAGDKACFLRSFHSTFQSGLPSACGEASPCGRALFVSSPVVGKSLCRFPHRASIATLMQIPDDSPKKWSHFIIRLQNEEAKNAFTRENILDLVSNLQKQGGAVPSKVWDRVGKLVVDHSGWFTPHDIVGVLHTLTKVQHTNASVVHQLCYKMDIVNLAQTWIPTLFYSLGVLSKIARAAEAKAADKAGGMWVEASTETWSLPPGFLDKVLTRSGLPKSISNYNERHIACLVYGMGQLNLTSLNPWVAKILDEVQALNKLSQLSPKGLSIVVYSIGKMQLDSKPTMHPFLERLSDPNVVARVPLGGLSNIMATLGKLGWADEMVRGCAMSVLNEICRDERLVRLSSWDLVSTWAGIATLKLDCEDKREILARETAKPRRITSMSEQGLTRTIHSVVKLGVRDKELTDGLIKELMKPDRLEELTVSGGSMVLSSLDKLRGDNPSGWHNEIETIVLRMTELERLSQTTIHDLEAIVHGLSVVTRHKQPHAAVDRVVWRVKMWGSRGKLSELSPRKLCSLMRGLFGIGIRDRLLWNGVVKEMFPRKARYDEFDINDLASLMYILGSLVGLNIKGLRYVNTILDSLIDWVVKPEGRLSECSHVSISNVVLGLSLAGKLHGDVGGLLAEEMLADRRFLHFPLTELRNVASGFVRAKSLPKDVVRVVLDRLVMLEDGSDVRSAAWVLHSLTKGSVDKLGDVVEKLMSKVDFKRLSHRHLSMITEAVGSFRPPQSKGLDRYLREALKRNRLIKYTDKQFVWLIFMLGRLGMKKQEPIDSVLRLFLHNNRLAKLPPDALSISFYGLALLGHNIQAHYDTILDKLKGKKGYQELSDNALLNVFHAIGKIRYGNKENLNDIAQAVAMPERVERLLKNDRLGQVFHTLGRLARAHSSLSIDFQELVEKATSLPSIELLPERTLGSIVFALSYMDHSDHHTVDRIVEEVCSPHRLTVFSWKRLVDILYRLGELQFSEMGGKPVNDFLKEIGVRADKGEFTPSWLNQIVAGLMNLSEKKPEFAWSLTFIDKILTEENLALMDIRRLARLVILLERQSVNTTLSGDALGKHLDAALRDLHRGERLDDIRLCSSREVQELLLMFARRAGEKELEQAEENDVVLVLVDEVSKPDRMIRYEVQEIKKLMEACKVLGVSNPDAMGRLEEGMRIYSISDLMETSSENSELMEVTEGS